jgi:uncharacterized protein
VKVLVAGGSGLIGRALCAELARLGHDPTVLTRQALLRMPGRLRSVVWHPPALGAWTEELANFDAVVNLAGESVGRWPWTAVRKRVLRDSRVEPTRALVSAIAALPAAVRPRVLINGSGTDLYEGLDAKPADEETRPAGTFLAIVCRDWEAEAQRANDLGVRVVLARTSLVIAPRAPSVRLLTLPFRLLIGGPIGSGQQWVSWIDIDDAVSLIIWAIETETVRGALNLCAPDPRHQADVAQAIGTVLHRPAWFRTPAWAVRLAFGEQATLALGSRRVWPTRALAAGYSFGCSRLEESLQRRLG